MNEETKEKLIDIFTYIIVGYIFISWLLAILLPIYNYFVVPINNALIPMEILSYNLTIQQIQQLNASLIGNISQLNPTNYILTPIPFNQFIKDELILIVSPAILLVLGLIYYDSEKENHDDQ